jgi:hypothetical protein
MPSQDNDKKRFYINGSKRLNSDLAYIRRRTEKSNRVLLEDVFCPLAILLKNKVDGNYCITVQNNEIVISVYSRAPKYFSSKATSTLNDILGVIGDD